MAHKEQITTVSDGLLLRAPAKINLSLLIAGKRPDGFHEIETVMAKINFYDEILIQNSQKPGIDVIVEGPCWAPQQKENIIYDAAKLLLDTCNVKANLKITLTKNIPAGSGLGSASSDAATTLLGLNKLLKLDVGHEKLSKIAAQLSADAAFFLGGPLAFCTGKGEKIEKINKKFDFLAILTLPNVNVSTKRIYEHYKHDETMYKSLNSQIKPFLEKNNIDLISKMCANMLQVTCFHLYEELAELNAKIESAGLRPLALSGSGSVMFYIVDNANEKKAKQCQRRLTEKLGCQSVLVGNNRW